MKTKTILILALAACFAFAGCSEDNGDSFKPAETVPASQTTMTLDTTNASESSESQTETTTETTTESTTTTTEPTTTTEAETTTKKKTTTTTQAATKTLQADTVKLYNGAVLISGTADVASGTITVVYDNNTNDTIRVYGVPSIIDIEKFNHDISNKNKWNIETAPHSKTKVEYSVDKELLQSGVQLKGDLQDYELVPFILVFK